MKKALMLCSILLIISLQAKMVIGQNCQVTFGPRDISVYGGIKINQNKILNNSQLIKFDPASMIQFIGSAEDTVTNICTLNNVTVNKSKGNILLEQNLNVLGQLKFIKGNIITGNNILNLASPASAVKGECSDAKVIGNIKSERFIGTDNSNKADHFGGIGLKINDSGNDIGNVTVLRNTEESAGEIKRTWKIETSIPFTGTRNVSVYWDDSEQKSAYFEIDKATTLTVVNSADVAVPQGLSMGVTSKDMKLSWAQVKSAVEYKVYSSTDPYGTFEIDESGSFDGTEWTAPLTEQRKFFYVTAVKEK
ncbi:MAG: hypothetical protein KKD38_03970 [Candidatus Delongbacteria bacterium]|nr:hypothetical protein [Candidatus Delongbacteria bacterium]MCG2760807.1 hypothetical protein [Candidatus Delongbacteria bacterium]